MRVNKEMMMMTMKNVKNIIAYVCWPVSRNMFIDSHNISNCTCDYIHFEMITLSVINIYLVLQLLFIASIFQGCNHELMFIGCYGCE